MGKRLRGRKGIFMKLYRILDLLIAMLMAGLGVLILMDKIVMNPMIAGMILLYGVYNLIKSFYIYRRRK